MEKQLLEKWEKLYLTAISKEDYKKIGYNLYGFVSTLKRWQDKKS